ncbi:MAG: hypothetical protein PHP08_01170 [Candidatus Dojkabacteria bacterium]|nr:hypothetical protein [Candidatus Dojkabacteria bacterium]
MAITILASLLFFPQNIYAETISPSLTEDTLAVGETSEHSLEFTNDNGYDIFITPKLYKYYPQSEYVLDLESYEEIVEIDNDYIPIPANTTSTIHFKIKASEALDPGTYYNLIVFEQTGTQKEDSTIGASEAISHLVKLNIVDNPDLEIITDDYDTNIEVISRGIPFIKPAILKVTFYNNSPYTLIPTGEIQVIKKSGDKEPEYIKINMDRMPVYPEQSFEKEYEVENWYLEDIVFGKTAYMYLQNGLDDTTVTAVIEIPGFLNEFLYILGISTILILLIQSIKKDSKPKQKSSD